jgi:Leu/Phe-tRNA-protein transferase
MPFSAAAVTLLSCGASLTPSVFPNHDNHDYSSGFLTSGIKTPLTIENVLNGYYNGIFFWRNNSGDAGWYVGGDAEVRKGANLEPASRGILDFSDLHVSKEVQNLFRQVNTSKVLRQNILDMENELSEIRKAIGTQEAPAKSFKRRDFLLTEIPMRKAKLNEIGVPYEITYDQAFDEVMQECANAPRDNNRNWLNDELYPLQPLYSELNRMGYGRSVEIWDINEDGKRTLVGGTIGFLIEGVFYGESIFVKRLKSDDPNIKDGLPAKNSYNKSIKDTGRLAVVEMVKRLNAHGFTWFDGQTRTSESSKFGTKWISQEHFHRLLDSAHQYRLTMPVAPKTIR